MILPKRKGQTSFEALFIAMVILILAVTITNYYTTIKDETVAMGLLKTNTLKALNAGNSVVMIKNIEFDEDPNTSTINLYINTIPESGITCDLINAASSRQLILDAGAYTTVNIRINRNTDNTAC
ncbi:MAG: hypothetical protein JW772_03790 [Candidatus Diapherotrites archaeon]|nr:hypothetical protein [Candidatus Diapherotrites archaeon]